MITKRLWLAVFIFLSAGQVDALKAEGAPLPRIDIAGGALYLNGNKFLVKGVGYSPFRPGVYPGAKVPLDIVEADFKRIKEAGFNTLRVWATMPEEQLVLAEKYGLNVIQAAGVKPDAKFDYEGFLRLAESQVRQMARTSRNHPNVIMYLLTNEPHAQSIFDSGIDKTVEMYKKLIAIVKQEDPLRPVSMANAYWTLWLDQSIWDAACFNVYRYDPALVVDIGYVSYIENLRAMRAEGKPFLVTEFGLSVSPQYRGGKGYGGNTQEEQAAGITEDWRSLVGAGAIGGCVFEWNDEWWKGGNAAVHDADPEEWFGIVGIENGENPSGTPRKAYYAIKEELKLVVTRPGEGSRIVNASDIEVNAAGETRNVRYKIDEGQWVCLDKHEDWWRGTIAGESLEPGIHVVTIQGQIPGQTAAITRKVNIIKCATKDDMSPPIRIELAADKADYQNGDIMKIKARILDRAGNPLENYPIKMGVLNAASRYARSWSGRTNERGFFTGSIPVIGRHKEWYYIYWAGAETEEYSYRAKEGAIGCARAAAGAGFPMKWITAKKVKQVTVNGVEDEEWQKADKIEINADSNFVEGTVKDKDDLSAEARVLWDEGNLYLLVDVKDDMPANNSYEKWDLWKGDGIELFISVDPSKIQERGYTNSDFQILIGANGRMWTAGQTKGGVRNNVPVLSSASVEKSEKGYTLKAKINVSNFWDKSFKTFKQGDILGFDIAIDDADNAGIRKGKLIWNGTEEGYKDSAVWGRLKLE